MPFISSAMICQIFSTPKSSYVQQHLTIFHWWSRLAFYLFVIFVWPLLFGRQVTELVVALMMLVLTVAS